MEIPDTDNKVVKSMFELEKCGADQLVTIAIPTYNQLFG